MPERVELTESYRCPGPWPWQWTRTCTRQVTRWCYNFEWVKEYRWGIACYLEGCENGILYSWWAFCLNIFGTATFFNIRKCFTNALSQKGRC